MGWVLARALVWAWVVGDVGAPTPGQPDGQAPRLRWSAPPGCPRAEQIERMVLGSGGEGIGPGGLEVEGSVRATAGGFALDLRLTRDGRVDHRQVTAEACAALGRVTALLVALAMDPVATAERNRAPAPDADADALGLGVSRPPVATSESTPDTDALDLGVPRAPTSERDAETSVPRPSATNRETTPDADAPDLAEPRRDAGAGHEPAPPGSGRISPPRVAGGGDASTAPPALRLAAEGGVESGAVPGVAGVLGLAATVAWPRAQVELAGIVVTPRTRQTAAADVQVLLGAISGRACARLRWPRLEVPVCGGVEAGGMRGEGRRAPEARTARGPWLAALVGVGLRRQLGARLALFGRVDAVVPLLRSGFRVAGPGDPEPVFVSSPVTGRVVLGLDVTITGPRDGKAPGRRSRGGPVR